VAHELKTFSRYLITPSPLYPSPFLMVTVFSATVLMSGAIENEALFFNRSMLHRLSQA
jgi:hypothetical protein